MRNQIVSRVPAVLILSLAAACGGNKSQPQYNGRVAFSAKTNVHSSVTAALPSVCAHFVLQPVSIDAAGHETPAGSPVSIDSTSTSQTDVILGCLDDGNTATPNWGYQVTASGWKDCATGAALSTATPTTAFTNATVSCTKSQDVPLNITVDVSIPVANNAGYIDISVAVNSTTVQTGCKNADYATGSTMLHFGESNIDPKGGILQGLIGIDNGAPNQWAGTVNAGAAPSLDTYYTGQLDTAAANTSLIYQTFLAPCATGEQFAGVHQAQCITTTAGGATPATVASLADAFIESANGFAAASIASATTIQIYSNYSVQPPNLSNAGASPATTGINPGTAAFTVTAQAGSFTGIYIDQSTADQLLVTGLDAGGIPSYATLSFSGGAWTLGSWNAISSLSAGDLACKGLFTSPASCFTPKACAVKIELPKPITGEQCTIPFQNIYNTHKCAFPTTRTILNNYCNEFWVCTKAYNDYLTAYENGNSGSCNGSITIDQCTVTGPNNGDCHCP